MNPVHFKGVNLNNPEGDHPCCSFGNGVVSCWKMTILERLRVFVTGRVWLSVMGEVIPPINLYAANPLQRQYTIRKDKENGSDANV